MPPASARRTRSSTLTRPHAGALPWHPGWAIVGLAGAIALIVFACAKPIGDSDLWFHLAYARQMIANRSLIPDHAAFSWTPADNATIYCAWLGQLALYALYQIGGLSTLFMLRYLVFTLVLLVVFSVARRAGVVLHPLTWFLTNVGLLMASAAFTIKPNLLSFLFLTLTVYVWHSVRHGRLGARYAYLLPPIMLVWVNSHGGFLVGLGFLGLAAVGEVCNIWLSPGAALTSNVRRHLLVAVFLCAVAGLATPYAARYPLQLFTMEIATADFQAVREYDSIFAASQRGMRYAEYGTYMAASLLVLAVARARKGALDCGLIFTNVAFAVLYTRYARFTAFWAPVAIVSGVTLLGSGPRWPSAGASVRMRWIASGLLLASLLLAGRAIRADTLSPTLASWQGFGNSYWNPEEEAEYIAQHFAGLRLGNDYNAGSYLLWRLWPDTKVFIDARYFPYRSWFQEYRALETTVGIEGLLRKYPADVWCIEHLLRQTIRWFQQSPDWEPAFYGPSAAVFVRRGTALPNGRIQSGSGIADVRNLYQAQLVLAFALAVNDVGGAARTVAGMERRFTAPHQRPIVAAARSALARATAR